MEISMTRVDGQRGAGAEPESPLPLAAPCRRLSAGAPLGWLRRGWKDLFRARRHSLTYGLLMVLLCYVVGALTWSWGELGLYLGLLSTVVFFGPCQALVLY